MHINTYLYSYALNTHNHAFVRLLHVRFLMGVCKCAYTVLYIFEKCIASTYWYDIRRANQYMHLNLVYVNKLLHKNLIEYALVQKRLGTATQWHQNTYKYRLTDTSRSGISTVNATMHTHRRTWAHTCLLGLEYQSTSAQNQVYALWTGCNKSYQLYVYDFMFMYFTWQGIYVCVYLRMYNCFLKCVWCVCMYAYIRMYDLQVCMYDLCVCVHVCACMCAYSM